MRHLRPPLALAVLVALAAPAAAQPSVPFEDAAVHAVQFIDKSEGWAVGDDGVVWHSIDGGATWERQKTGTRTSLRSVHFNERHHGPPPLPDTGRERRSAPIRRSFPFHSGPRAHPHRTPMIAHFAGDG